MADHEDGLIEVFAGTGEYVVKKGRIGVIVDPGRNKIFKPKLSASIFAHLIIVKPWELVAEADYPPLVLEAIDLLNRTDPDRVINRDAYYLESLDENP